MNTRFLKLTFVLSQLIGLAFSAQAIAQSTDADFNKKLGEYRIAVLDSRLRQHLANRFLAVRECSHIDDSHELYQYVTEVSDHLKLKSDLSKADLMRSLSLYSRGQTFIKMCQWQFTKYDQALIEQEKMKFSVYGKWADDICNRKFISTSWCQKNLAMGIVEIAPHCQVPLLNNFDGSKSDKVCFAGDFLMAKTFQIDTTDLNELLDYLKDYHIALEVAEQSNKKVDLYEVYQKKHPVDSIETRDRFISVLGFFYTSENSSVADNDGWSEYLVFEMIKAGKSPEEILRKYEQMKKLKDSFFYHLTQSREDKIRLFIGNFEVTNRNHHDFHAAFMGCHYRHNGLFLSLIWPRLLGLGYESIQAYEELKSGESPNYVVDNFTTDVARHNTASWGYHFCKMDSKK